MDSQTINQTINILIGNNSSSNTTNGSNLANTGTSSLGLLIAVGITIIILSIIIWRFTSRRNIKLNYRNINNNIKRHTNSHKLNYRKLSILALILTSLTALIFHISTTQAIPTLSLGTNQNNLTVTIPEGGGTATTNTTITTSTINPSGYKLTATLAEPEPGIAISLKGGDLTNNTNLTPNNSPLTLKTTSTTATNDTTELTLTFNIDSSVTPGTKNLQLSYQATDNQPATPTTMQQMTQSYCQNNMTIYNGTNEEAILTLTDPRGTTHQTYQVAKLADNNCWMLNNLKLGSTTSTTNLTPQDTDITTNFTLPQVVTSGTADPDNPGVYGPVPGDTGSGATNYGYLYNYSSATAGESRTSHPETAGNAPHSICPKNWRLPIGGADTNTGIPLPTNEFNELSARMAGFPNGQDNTYLSNYSTYYQNWQHNSTFKGTFAGVWWEGFGNQGYYGLLWSSSAFPDNADLAFFAYFLADEVGPGNVGGGRDGGIGVRCLLN